MSDIEALAKSNAEELQGALVAIVDDAATALDAATIEAVISSADDGPVTDDDRDQLEAVLGLGGGDLGTLGDTLDASTFADGIGSLFVAVAALAAGAVHHALNARDNGVSAARQSVVDGFRSRYLADNARAIRETAERMLNAIGPASTRAAQLRRMIGLSPAQARSLDALRRALHTYLSVAHRDPDVELIVSATRGHLSGAQQQMLRKLIRGGLDLTAAETALDRHAAALRNARTRAIVGDLVHEISETAKLAGWTAAQRAGKLPATQRRDWRTAGDERVRHTHAAIPGMNPGGVPLDQPFATPLGPTFAPPLEYGCRCRVELIR